MRYASVAPPILGLTILLTGCSGQPGFTSPDPASQNSPILIQSVSDPGGTTQEALAVYWLARAADSPLTASLEMSRQLTAQGDLYALSVRPFMAAANLRIIGTSAGPNDTTDYELRFTHPFAMPTDLDRPYSATKRVDLFLFDVQTVLTVTGTDQFFDGAVQTNTSAMPGADGYRALDPLVDVASMGITDGTNVFPYRVFSNVNEADPNGSYSASVGWAENWSNPTGYDVIPQGGSATATVRVANGLPGTIGVVVLAKYMDPRAGSTPEEKRANRLPDPEDDMACMYFLPEAAGDLQSTYVSSEGLLKADSSLETATLTAQVLDWDNVATVATSFPDYDQPTAISELSKPTQIAADFPDLHASGTFTGTVGASSGSINQFIEITIPVQNVDRTYIPANPAGDAVTGLIRLQDTQDLSSPAQIALDETLAPVSGGSGFGLSTRYQIATVQVASGPIVTEVSPLVGTVGQSTLFAATVQNGPVTSWLWDFGGGATPNTSTLATPSVTLGIEGPYDGSVTVVNTLGESTFDFSFQVNGPQPNLPPTPFNYANLPLPRHFTDPTAIPGFLPIVQSDNTPGNNQVTDAGATLGRVLFYDKRLSVNNAVACASCHIQAAGFSDPAPRSLGFAGGQTGRHSMSLANARYYDNGRMFWDERASTLEEQVLLPIQDSVEMGMTLPALEQKLARAAFYPALFQAAFGDSTITSDRISRALAQYVRSIVSYRSKFDQAMVAGPGESPDFEAVFTPQELLGLAVYQGFPGITATNMQCNQCHATATQTLGAAGAPPPGPPPGPFATNNGLDLNPVDPGAGNGRFKSPSLRNISVTGPYMHDGRFPALDNVITFYAQGVVDSPNTAPQLRVGGQPGNPIERFTLTPDERAGLVAFLQTLTDQPLLTDVKYSNPFPN